MAAEFACVECGQPVIRLGVAEPPEFRFCAACLTVPGWFRCARMRTFLRADHDGVEAWEREGDAPVIIQMRDTDG